MEKLFISTGKEISFRIRNQRIMDFNGNVAVAVWTQHGRYPLHHGPTQIVYHARTNQDLFKADQENEVDLRGTDQAPAIVPDRFLSREENEVHLRGSFFNHPSSKEEVTNLTTSPIRALEMKSGEIFAVTSVDREDQPVIPYGTKLVPGG